MVSKQFGVAAMLLLLLVFTNCKSKNDSDTVIAKKEAEKPIVKDATNSPLYVLQQMKANVQSGDVTGLANNMCDRDRKKLNTAYKVSQLLLGSRGKVISEFLSNHLFKNNELRFENIEFKDEKIDGETATVAAYNQKKEKTKIFNFVKEGNIWKMCK